MQYVGYLRRNPNAAPEADFSGYNFWLTKLNNHAGDYVAAEMVKSFITSGEFRQRFRPADASLKRLGDHGMKSVPPRGSRVGSAMHYLGKVTHSLPRACENTPMSWIAR